MISTVCKDFKIKMDNGKIATLRQEENGMYGGVIRDKWNDTESAITCETAQQVRMRIFEHDFS